MTSVHVAPVRDVKGATRKTLSEAQATRKRPAILPKKLRIERSKYCRRTDQKAHCKRHIAKQLQTNKPEDHLLAFGFPTGGDIEKIQIGGDGHDTDLGKVQHQLPIDCARFSRWPGQQHRDCGRYPEYEKDV